MNVFQLSVATVALIPLPIVGAGTNVLSFGRFQNAERIATVVT
jgi:hypothetical protein